MEYEDSESLIRIKIGFIFKKLWPVENRQWGVRHKPRHINPHSQSSLLSEAPCHQ